MRGFIRRALYFFAILAILLVLTEAGLQILRPYSLVSYCEYVSPHIYFNDGILGCRTAPNQKGSYERADLRNEVVLNNYGNHDTYTGPKGENEFRILVIGGSFSANLEVAVEDTWPKLFEKKLQKTNPKVKVVNFGNPAIAFDYFLSYFKEYRLLEEIKPDLIISAFSFHRLNDIVQPILKFKQYKGCVFFYRSSETLPMGENLIDWRNKSILFRLFKSSQILRRSFLFRLAFQADCKRLTFATNINLRGNILYVHPAGPERVSTRKVIEELDGTVRAFGCPIVFYYIPQASACNPRDIQICEEQMRSLHKGIGRRRKIISSRLLKKFNEEGRGSVYFPFDEHPNKQGIRCIAEEIYEDIMKARLVPLE